MRLVLCSVAWNLCMHDEERDDAGMDSLCWWDEMQTFKTFKGRSVNEVNIRASEW